MKKAIYMVLVCCCVFAGRLNAQQWQWAHSSTCSSINGGSEGWLVKSDHQNNVFMAGIFYGDSICLGPDGYHSASANGVQTIVVKYDSAGNQLWSKAGRNGYSRPIAITTDHKGNFYVFGYFLTDSIRFDDQLLVNNHYDHIHPGANASYYLLKYTDVGDLLWAVNSAYSFHPAGDYLKPGGIAVDVSGDVYISATFNSDTFDIEGTKLLNTAPVGDSSTDIFLAKYNTSGSLLWAKSFGGLKDDYVLDVASNGYRVFLTGYFTSGYLSFDGSRLYNGSKKGYLTCLDLNGTVKWVRSTGGKGIARCVSTDKKGNVYVAGGFRDTLAFDTYEIRKTYGGYFLTRFDSTGVMLTPKIIEPVQAMSACCDVYSMTTDPCNNIWVTINQEPGKGTRLDASTVAYPPAGSVDPVLIAGYNSDGDLFDHISLTSAGGYGIGLANSGLASDNNSNLLFSGDYRAADPFVVGKDSLHLYNGQLTNIFVAKYRPVTECSEGPPPVYPDVPVIIVYPSPAGGDATLSYTGRLGTGATMALHDIAGKLIRVYPLTQQLTPFSVTDLPSGVYMCMVHVEGREMYTLRLVVRH